MGHLFDEDSRTRGVSVQQLLSTADQGGEDPRRQLQLRQQGEAGVSLSRRRGEEYAGSQQEDEGRIEAAEATRREAAACGSRSSAGGGERAACEVAESGSSSIVEIVDEEKGTFIIKDWSDYPDDYVPVPDQNKVWTFLEGDEYNSARDSANIFNRNMRAADPYYANNGLEIHEIEPVKMGGSPTDINNKTAIQSQVHRRYVTPWWSKIRDEVKKGLN